VSTLRSDDVVLSDADHRELLETIEDQSDHLARLVANLLDMARLESGTLTLRRGPHPLDELVEAALLAAGSALAHHVVRVDVPEDLPLVDLDLVLIAQVVANLLSNAAQHSPEGSTITLAARTSKDDVEIRVSDEGTGVPDEDKERIFHMLDRNAGSGRAGLGLAISTAFVGAHGRQLRVADTAGGGATFSFQVPAADLSSVRA
jgi:two-component system sensor histidine kinase KdpD